MHETACIKCNAISSVPLDVAALDSLKANLMTQPRHRYLHLIYEFIFWTGVFSYLTPRGRAESVRSSSRWTAGDGFISRSRSDGYDEDRIFSLFAGIWSVGFQSDGVGDTWKNTTIAVRSNRDRGAIEPRSWILPRGIYSTTFARQFRSIWNTIDARSWSIVVDHAKIVAYFEALFEAKFKSIRPGFEATTPLSANRSHDALIPRPWPPLSPTISGQFPSLKACISLSCSSTFDRLVKKLSKFRGRSLVHRVPPAFRLDCEAIGVGLITNFSLISSNFPLEFRTSTRKNPSKFASIHENWSPILAAIGLVVRFDRLSGGNLSFY